MSILPILSNASIPFREFPDRGSPIISPSAAGTTCHDTPKRSLSQPHGPSSPPSERRFQVSSSSSCVSQVATSEIPSEKEKLGPPSIGVKYRPSSSHVACSTLPFGRGFPSLRTTFTIFEFLMTET